MRPPRPTDESPPGSVARPHAARLIALLALPAAVTCDWIAGLGNDAPHVSTAIADQVVPVDSAVLLDLAGHFADPDGDSLEYAAVPAAPAVASATVSGGMLSVRGVAAGRAAVTVTASDPDDLTAQQSFDVTVPNRAPLVTDAIADGEVFVDDTLVLDAAEHFTDPDGDQLTYAASSSDPARVAARLSASTLEVTGMAVGSSTVTVTAQDPGGLVVRQEFGVTVPNRAPEAVGTIAARVVEVDSVRMLEVTPYFADPDRDTLEYAASPSDSTRLAVAASAGVLTLTGLAKGRVAVTVTARDPGGLAAGQTFPVTVPNRTPVAVGAIADRELFVGDGAGIAAAAYFADPDGDDLEYAAASSDTTRAAVGVSGDTVTVTGAAVGAAAVTVTARDPEGLSAEQVFAVTVPNRAPGTVGRIADRDVYVGDTLAIDAEAFFFEPDGQVLAYAAASASAATATAAVSGGTVIVTGTAVGSTRVTVAARDPEGLSAEQVFAVTVPNRAPGTVGRIADREVEVDSVAVVDAAAFFFEPDGQTLQYAAASSDPALAAATVSQSTLTVRGVAKGRATISVAARDPGGLSAEQSFVVTLPNRAPGAAGPIADRELHVGQAVEVVVAAHFADPDGDALRYAASSSDTARVTVAVAGDLAAVTGVGVGTARVAVTARDPEGLSAGQHFAVTVPNRAPEARGAIPALDVYVGDTVMTGVAAYFADPDGHALAYAAASSDTTRVAVAVAGDTVTVTGAAVGEAAVTVIASDPEGLSADQVFAVTLPNRSPAPLGEIADLSVEVGRAVKVDVTPHFADPDGEALEYATISSDATRAAAAASGGTVTVTGVAKGSATVQVTARDPGGLEARQGFEVTVPNRSPEAVGAIADRVVEAGRSAIVDLAAHFTDPDGDDLDYSARSSDIGRATAAVSGSVLTVAGVAGGSVTVTATARDDGGLSADQRFGVTVPNRAPQAVGAVGDMTVRPDKSLSLDVASHFTDPDGDELQYAAESSDTASASVGVSGSTVTVTGGAEGEATVTMTATDPGELSAVQRFDVAVETPPPSDLIVESASATPSVLGPEEPFDLDAVVRNRGEGRASSTSILRYYRSADTVIGAEDTRIGTDPVPRLDPSDGSPGYVALTSPSEYGTYHYGACVDAVDNESDTDNNCSGAVAVEVAEPNEAPRPVGTIPDDTVEVRDEVSVDVEPYFTDPDGDELRYAAESSDPATARVGVSGSTVTVSGEAEGAATVTVTATDPGDLSATASFAVEVEPQPNRPPFVADSIVDIDDATASEVYRTNLLEVFEDPDGDELTWSTTSSDTAAVRSRVAGDTLSVTAVAVGSATVTVTATDAGDLSSADTFEVTVAAARFDLDIWRTPRVSNTEIEYMEEARDSWEAILKDTELEDITFTSPVRCLGLQVTSIGTVDDHAVFVHVDSIDGPGRILAYATYCHSRASDDTPVISAAVFDEADIDSIIEDGNLTELASHEMGHGLGFTAGYWEERDLVETGDDPHFTGDSAVGAFDDAGGDDYEDNKVPVSSRDHSHWRWSVFGRERMSAFLVRGRTHPLSAITVQAMGDAGYEVDASLVDDYELPGPAPPPDMDPADPGRVFDLSGDFVRGPVTLIDADGRTVRVVPSPAGLVPPTFRTGEVRIERRGSGAPGKWVRSAPAGPPPGRR